MVQYKNLLKEKELTGYKYIPAAIQYRQMGGNGLYIKYKKSCDNNFRVISQNTDHIYIETPDRYLLLVDNYHFDNSMRPLDCGFDEYVSYDTFGKAFKDYNIDFLMTNYTDHLGGNPREHNQRKNGSSSNGTTYVCDSGGFQILSNQLEYIDPSKLAEWYNRNTDIGITLDIPTPFNNKQLLERSAKVAKANTEEILKNLNSSVELINVFHGVNPESYEFYRKIVERKDLDRVCIGGFYRVNLLTAISNVIGVITTGKQYKHYHVLGVYDSRKVPVLAKLANSGICKLLTSDSSSALQFAVNRTYHYVRSADIGPEKIPIGIKSQISHVNTHKKLPCSCPVCTKIKYTDILSLLSGNVANSMFILHNTISISDYTQMLNEYAANLSAKEYREVIKSHLLKSEKVPKKDIESHETLLALDFIDDFLENGLDHARQKYKNYIDEPGLIHSNQGVVKSLYANRSNIDTKTDAMLQKRIDKAVSIYEDPNVKQNKVHGKRVSDKDKDNVGEALFAKS